jgi:20S proteasome alpha/beta subunit
VSKAPTPAILHFAYPAGRRCAMLSHRSPVRERSEPLSPDPSSVGLSVTVGTALKPASGNDFIVTVSDMRVSLGNFVGGVDVGTHKVQRLDDYWGFLGAADDLGYVSPLREKARDLLFDISGRRSLLQAREVVTNAYHSVRTEVAFNKYIKMYGFTSMAEFLKDATKSLGSEITSELFADVKNFDLRVSLLVYGFDEDNEIHLFEIRNPGEPIARDDLPFWAIGSGATLAMGALTSRTHLPIGESAAVYRACEAKFAAQFAPGVGEATNVFVWYPDGKAAYLDLAACRTLRQIYESSRDPPISEDAGKLIYEALKAAKAEYLIAPSDEKAE